MECLFSFVQKVNKMWPNKEQMLAKQPRLDVIYDG